MEMQHDEFTSHDCNAKNGHQRACTFAPADAAAAATERRTRLAASVVAATAAPCVSSASTATSSSPYHQARRIRPRVQKGSCSASYCTANVLLNLVSCRSYARFAGDKVQAGCRNQEQGILLGLNLSRSDLRKTRSKA